MQSGFLYQYTALVEHL